MGSLLIKIIIEQLNQYINSVENDSDTVPVSVVVLGNMAQTSLDGTDSNELNNKVVVSLVNIAEESTLKNISAFRQIDGQQQELQPPVYINLYLLFAANISDYSDAIDYILRVIEFFQGKKVFNIKNSLATPVQPRLTELID